MWVILTTDRSYFVSNRACDVLIFNFILIKCDGYPCSLISILWVVFKTLGTYSEFFKMETLVLIPQELSLALRPGGARGKEASVSVWSSIEILRGTALYPFQGTIRIDKLHVYSYVPDHDVSKFFRTFQ